MSRSMWACTVASSKVEPSITTVAPKLSVFSIFTKGVPAGMTMVTGMPSRWPW